MKNNLLKKITTTVLIFLFIACTSKPKQEMPVAVLAEYINVAMAAKKIDDKKKLMELTTGEAKEELQKMSDKDFDAEFIQSGLHFIGFKTKDLREELDGSLSLIYELSYDSKSNGSSATITNKKIAYMGKDDSGHWKIKSTKNVKSLVEKKDALEVMKQ